MEFLYDTHIHTSLGSKCGKDTPEEQVHRFAARGYTGIFITDHFFNGNTSVPYKEMAWEDAIDQYFLPYERAKAEGEKVGLDVFFGFENSYQGNDILTYGLGREWLKAHPEIVEMEMRKYCDFVRAEGGLVLHAHPFREASYINLIRLLPRSVDGVEGLNANCTDFQNKQAQDYAFNYGLATVGGSDIHRAWPYLTATASPIRFTDDKEFCQAVRDRLVSPVVTFDGREEGKLCD